MPAFSLEPERTTRRGRLRILSAGPRVPATARRARTFPARVTAHATDVEDHRARARELGPVRRGLAGRDHPATAVTGVVRLRDEQAPAEPDGFAVPDEPAHA
ncbi:hypothetical protein ACFQ7A_18755 [Streptomyces sp. NPDC056528]|uniref:hypothetical protein n=1 Tax=Streptomyces sp. NPDC056528 TaxID=3345854 RepID=UPI0036CD4079